MDTNDTQEQKQNETPITDTSKKKPNTKGYLTATITMMIISAIFYIVQILVGGGMNYGLFAVVFSGSAAICWIKWLDTRKHLDLFLASANTFIVILCSAGHIYNLITMPHV